MVACDIAAQIDTVPYPMATAYDLDETVALICKDGGSAVAVVLDVRDSVAVSAVVERIVSDYRRLDILVANAGVTGFSPIEEVADNTWADMIATNLTGAFYCVREVIGQMRRQQYGRIVAISSGAGRAGMSNLGHYAASKWGLIGLIKTVALETARDGITANVICPTTVRTPMVVNDATLTLFCPEIQHPTVEDALPRFAELSPMGTPWLEPEDVSRAVMYLVTDPGYTSGTVLEVNLATSASRT